MFKPGAVMYARAAAGIARHNCEFCGAELTAHQGVSAGICDKPQCHERMIEKVGTELLARKRRENAERLAKMYEKMAPQVAEAAAAIGGTPETIIPAKVPFQGKPVVPVPEARRAAFEKHLRWIIARAFTEEVPENDLSYREDLNQDEPPLVDAACGMCRGGCCELGGDTGFLQDVDIGRWRQLNPGATEDEIADYYLGMVPPETTEDCCIYQGPMGCVLPREKRNDQCNAFYCKSLKLLQERIAEATTDKVVIISDDDGEARGVAGWSPETGTVLVYESLPGEKPADNRPSISFGSDDMK